jgi:hypothetical protein
MVLAGHITDDLECYTNRSTCLLLNPLLRSSTAFLEINMDDCCHEGCYMYFDTKNSSWIRSGKSVGRKFPERHREHQKKSMLSTADDLGSKFYHSYPSREAGKLAGGMHLLAYSDQLQLYCGLGFDRSNATDADQNLTSHGKDRSLFVWPSRDLRKLKSVNFRGVPAGNLEKRQRNMVGYMCELAYDLAIPPSKNVSASPGFEMVLGVFGGHSATE